MMMIDPLCQSQSFTCEIVQVLQFCEFSVASDVRVIGGECHQKVDETDDDNEAGHGRQDEHDCGVLNIVLAKHLDFSLASHLHIFPYGTYKKTRQMSTTALRSCGFAEKNSYPSGT